MHTRKCLNLRQYSSEFQKPLPLEKDASGKTRLTTEQIERIKRELYDTISFRRDHLEAQKFVGLLMDNCAPNLHLFNVMLKAQLMMRNVDGIKSTLLAIAQSNFAFNAVTLNLLLVYYRDLGMMEEAEKLFHAMENHQNNSNPLINCAGPNLAAYTTMIAGWARQGNYEKAREYYEAISMTSQMKPDEQATCALLTAAVSTGHLDDARKLFESIKAPNLISSKIWFRACLRIGGREEAFKRLVEQENQSLELSELLRWIFTDLQQVSDQISASMYILREGLEAELRLGDPKLFMQLVEKIKSHGSKANFDELKALQQEYSRQLPRA